MSDAAGLAEPESPPAGSQACSLGYDARSLACMASELSDARGSRLSAVIVDRRRMAAATHGPGRLPLTPNLKADASVECDIDAPGARRHQELGATRSSAPPGAP